MQIFILDAGVCFIKLPIANDPLIAEFHLPYAVSFATDSPDTPERHVSSLEMNSVGFRLLHPMQTLKQNPNECNITIVGWNQYSSRAALAMSVRLREYVMRFERFKPIPWTNWVSSCGGFPWTLPNPNQYRITQTLTKIYIKFYESKPLEWLENKRGRE